MNFPNLIIESRILKFQLQQIQLRIVGLKNWRQVVLHKFDR